MQSDLERVQAECHPLSSLQGATLASFRSTMNGMRRNRGSLPRQTHMCLLQYNCSPPNAVQLYKIGPTASSYI